MKRIRLAILIVFGVLSAELAAQESEPLRLLQEKKQWEERQLERLAEMVRIPAGKFVMGYDGGQEDEKPAHTVFLDAFDIDKYEVTQLEYQSVIGSNPSYFGNCPLCPVEKVTHEDAAAYCEKIDKRLPTEAEWEKAARGGLQEVTYWGGDFPTEFAWYGNNSGRRSHPVGTMKPNPFGLHDMAGNVQEWVQDWYDPAYYRNSPAENPKGPASGTTRVLRGGGWGHVPELLRHTLREHREPKTRYITAGFRCAADLKS